MLRDVRRCVGQVPGRSVVPRRESLILLDLLPVTVLSVDAAGWSGQARVLDRLSNQPLSTAFCDKRDNLPLAYTAFVFGVTAGMLIRRTLPGMAESFNGLCSTSAN